MIQKTLLTINWLRGCLHFTVFLNWQHAALILRVWPLIIIILLFLGCICINLEKCLVASSCISVYLCISACLPLDRFLWKLILETSVKVCGENSDLLKILQTYEALYVNCVMFLLLYIAVSILFLYKFTDHCHQVEIHLQ